MVEKKEKVEFICPFNKLIQQKLNLGKSDFLKRYNPWVSNKVDDIIEKFLNNDDDFSWLDIEDKQWEKINNNIKFGIPNHVRGDIEKAELFICLTNPNIDIRDNNKFNSLEEYYSFGEENDKSKKSELKNQSEYKIAKANFEEAKKRLERAQWELAKIDDWSLNKDNFTDHESVKKHIYAFEAEDSILFNELTRFEEGKVEDLDQVYYLSHYFDQMIKDAYCLKTGSKTRDLAIILKDKKKPEGESKTFFELLKEASKKIVNLESYPFRSQNPGEFGKEIADSNTCVSLFSARIILWRIFRWEYLDRDEKTRPIFIFRRYEDFWEKQIKSVLQMDYGFKESELKYILPLLEKGYFYTINKKDNKQQTRYVSQATIYKNNEKIEDDDYNRILSIFLCNNKEAQKAQLSE